MGEFLSSIDWAKVAPIVVDFVLIVLLPLMYAAARKWLLAKTQGEKQAALLRLVDIVYVAVEAMAAKGTVGNKLQIAIGKVGEALGRPLTEPELKAATEAFAAKAYLDKSPSIQLGRDVSTTGAPKP